MLILKYLLFFIAIMISMIYNTICDYSSIAQLVEQSAVNRSVVGSSPTRGAIFGPLVKRLRHRPFTAITGVRFSHGSPLNILFRAISSAGRAPALQAGCRRFDPVIAHHMIFRCKAYALHFLALLESISYSNHQDTMPLITSHKG